MSIYAIERIKIIGTSLYTYTAWECDDEHCSHTAIKHIGKVRYGQISSRRLPLYTEAILVINGDREAALQHWQEAHEKIERRLIESIYPETYGDAFPAAMGTRPSLTGRCRIERDPTLPELPDERRWITEPACPGIITSRETAREAAGWIDEVLEEGESITLDSITITRRDDRLIGAGRPDHWTLAELAALLWTERKEVNAALRTHYLTSGATR